MTDKPKAPRGHIPFGKTVDEINGIKVGDHIVAVRASGWSPGQITTIYAPWTIPDAALPGGLRRFGYHVVAVHDFRSGTKNKGDTRWPLDGVRRISETEAKARLKAMMMPTSMLIRAFHQAFSPMHETQEALDAYAAEIDKRFPNPWRSS